MLNDFVATACKATGEKGLAGVRGEPERMDSCLTRPAGPDTAIPGSCDTIFIAGSRAWAYHARQ
ncbi:UNVERIFIED_ORG: hypothetical protein GGI57_005093 [Rhizobium aethiopicum]